MKKNEDKTRVYPVMRVFVFAVCMLSSFLLSCQKSSKAVTSSALKVNIVDDPSTLDPRRVRDLSGRILMNMLFEGITRISKEEKASLALAEKVDISDDGLTYRFTLKEAYWSNGDPITASDFIYSWKSVLDPKFSADNAFQLYPIKNAQKVKSGVLPAEALGVKLIAEKVFEVTLEKPTAYFLELLSMPVFFPVNERIDRENSHWPEEAQSFVCSGPFKVKTWKHNDLFSVSKNGSYWDAGQVRLSSIDMYMVKEDTEFSMFEKKELDWSGSPFSNLPLDALKSLKSSGNLHAQPILGTFFLRINTDRYPLNNAHLRRALALAIDRKAIIDFVLQGEQLPATGLVPSVMGLQDPLYFADHDTERAKELFALALEEMHMTKEEFPSFTFTYLSNQKNHLIAQAIQEQWRETLGIHIALESLERKVSFEKISKQDYAIAIGAWNADFNDPSNFLDVFKYKTASTNNTSWENPDYVHLLEQASVSNNPTQRNTLLKLSEQILISQMPIIPIYHYTMLYLSNKEVKDVVVTTLGDIDFKWAYLESDK